MNFEKELEESLKRTMEKAANHALREAIVTGIATQIDTEKRIFTLQREGFVNVEGISMNAITIEQNECTIIPKDGSAVAVVFVDGAKVGVMVNCSEVEKINIVIGKTKLMITADGVNIETEKMNMEIGNEEILFNGGENKGLVKIKELSDNLDSLKKYCEGLKSAISTGLSSVGESTAASGSAGKGAFEGIMASQNISFKNMENDKIKH